MMLNLVITSENNTVLEKITVEPRATDDFKKTEVTFADVIVEFLSVRFVCRKEL